MCYRQALIRWSLGLILIISLIMFMYIGLYNVWLLWHRGLPRTLESLTDISITPVVSALCLRKQNREGHETVTFGGPRKKFIIANVWKARLTIIFTKSICNFYQSYLQADSADSLYLLTMWVCTTGRTIESKQILNNNTSCFEPLR